MRLAAYITPRSTMHRPTGQTKHATNLLLRLAHRPGVQLTLLAARDQLTPDGRIPPESPLCHLPVTSIPLPAKALHHLWRTWRWPKIERWSGPVDWLYSPTEMFVATRRTPFASTIHCANWFEPGLPWSDDPDNRRSRQRIRRTFNPIFKHATVILTVSEFLKARLTQLFGLDPSRLAVIGNAAEDCYFDEGDRSLARTQPAAAPGYLLAVGALHPRKGARYLFDLAALLLRRGSRLRIRVAAGRLGLPHLVKEAQSHPNLELLDYVPAPALAKLMSASVAVLLLSRYESFGIPAVEAMAAGAPVIAAKFAALPEIVDGAGVLVNAGNTAEVADAAMALAADTELRWRYIDLGRQKAREFTWDACAGRLVNALRAAF